MKIAEKLSAIRFQKRAHNPLLFAASFDQTDCNFLWLGGRLLRLAFGQGPLELSCGLMTPAGEPALLGPWGLLESRLVANNHRKMPIVSILQSRQ